MTDRKTIVFLDNTYPKPYQTDSIGKQALGGTEASIIRTANILTADYNVFVVQKFRNKPYVESDHLAYLPKSQLNDLNPDAIVVLRKYPLLKGLRQQFPKAKLFLWIHTYKNTEYVFKRKGLAKTNTTIICNSNTHKRHTQKLLNSGLLGNLACLLSSKTNVTYCYNPIPKPKAYRLSRDSNKLLFFSSPNKGLDQVYKCFEFVNNRLPELKLYIANPGYKNSEELTSNKNIVILGSLPHDQMMQQVASSLCVFYPQDSFAETFGLIYAEANAYGTPVLAYDLGSAREILDDNNPLIDANDYDYDAIYELIKAWQKKFPQVQYNQAFSDESILNQWQVLFS
jgi:glycosyltransferase involved in cell wall biosynthesis